MTKKLMICLTAFAFMFSIAAAVGISYAKDTGPAEMTLMTEAAKKPAQFPHKKHQDAFKCDECHHGKDAAGMQVPLGDNPVAKCETCHNADMANPKLNSFKNAAHALCKTCHKKMAKEGKNAPTKCNGCHIKKK